MSFTSIAQGSFIRPYRNPLSPSVHARLSSRHSVTRSLLSVPGKSPIPEEVDVVVIGSGLGGLCCASLLAKYGMSVAVCESHSIAGGAAHSFVRDGFHFDSGPSFHAGLSIDKSLNPLKQVLDILEEKVECVTYDTWIGYLPEGKFIFSADAEKYRQELLRVGGEVAHHEWMALERAIAPLARAAAALPASALRSDPGLALTLFRYLPGLVPTLPWAPMLLEPFSKTVDQVVTDPFLKRMIDLECFVLSGMLADSTLTAEMAFMFFERSRPEGTIDYPVGGGSSIVDALVRGIRKNGGELLLNSHVEEILVTGGRASAVRLRSGNRIIRARKAIVSNASIWDTSKLLSNRLTQGRDFSKRAETTEETGSFLHLHLGIDATGLPDDLECHHLIVNDWELGVESPQNVIIVSIPSVFDPSLAPPGKHSIHCYSAGNEPYSIWRGLDRRSQDYLNLKEQRSQVLWKALEQVIPDVRDRAQLSLVGTPLTHERYIRRHNGTYGAAVKAGKQSWPGPTTEVEGLFCCGDSTMPGIGVPAVAASGLMAANSILPVWSHLDMLDILERKK